jgi:hypothetical protein
MLKIWRGWKKLAEKSDETEIPPASSAAAENCNEHNQNSSRIHFKFIINYRGFLLEEGDNEARNLCKFILRAT